MVCQNKINKTVWKESLVVFGILGTTVLSGALLTLPSASADDVVDTITITVPTSCSMSSTIATGDEHTAEINNGQYDSAIGETTIKAFCNDNEGFAIYAIGYTDNELGKNVLTNSTLGSTHDIATGTNLDGANSSWAMKLSTITSPTPAYPIIIAGSAADTLKQQTDSDFSDFTEVPDDYKKVAYRTASTDINPEGQQTAEGSTLKTTYQAYISPTQAAGEYTGQVKYTMLHPHTEPAPYTGEKTASGKICYYANASDSEGTMGCQDVASEVTLLASNFSRTGYGFAGWSDAFDYATNANAKFYGPNETITLTLSDYQSPNKGLSLYAVWVKSAGNLQDTDKVAELCGIGTNALTTAPTDGTANLKSVSALTDQRDNNTYAIAKLADGKCWMIENLRLDNTAEHNTDGTLSQGYHSSFIGLSGSESANFSWSTIANDLYTTENDIEGKKTISGDYQGSRFPRYNNLNTKSRAQDNPSSNSFTTDNTTPGMYSYGNYYTWHAAIANTTYYSGPTAQVDGKTSETVGTSLCPKGWKLPLGNTSTGNIEQGANDVANKVGGFSYLDRKMGGTGAYQSTAADSLRWRKYPVNFLYSGYFSSKAYKRGSCGIYWSSTADSNNASYELSLVGSFVSPDTYGNKYGGNSIRCVSGS